VSETWLRILVRLHGQLGALAVVALVHPAILLRDPRRGARLSVLLCAALVTSVFAGGLFLYPHYRAELRQEIFVASPTLGWAFERKEHLAFAAMVLAWVGAAAHLSVERVGEGARARLARLAHRAFAAALLCAVAAAGIGVAVGGFRGF
jgi:hypothetical protein